MDAPTSRIILTDAFDTICDEIGAEYSDLEIYRIDAEDFLIEHAKEAVERAVLTSDRDRILLLTALRFTPIAQNKLLKILEEPPEKTHFILMTPSKSGLLPTIRSRLVIENRLVSKEAVESGVDMAKFDLAALYTLLQENRRIDAKGAAKLLERLAKEAMQSGRYRMDEALLESFSEGIRLLDMGSPPGFVLTRVGLKLLQRRR
ncbi:DNA polymerase III subunit delta' [Hydrogenimonas sp.]